MQSPRDIFGPQSPLKALLEGYQPRESQIWMAEAVAAAIERGERLVVEAGTGTGKTFAYLVPALMSGRKTIISTGTKTLQDQLYHRDLPLIGKAIGRPVRTALLKGRANYLCLERLEHANPEDSECRRDLTAVTEWRYRTTVGDRAELTEVAEDSPVWPLVTSTAENCLGQKCPFYRECHVVAARRTAQEADLVVVNHHLLLADLAMKEGGFVEFLPGADVVILDEAHQIPDLATQFFGYSVGTAELERLLTEARATTVGAGQAELQRRYDTLTRALRELRLAAPRTLGRHEFSALGEPFMAAFAELRAALADVTDAVSELASASLTLDQISTQLRAFGERLSYFADPDGWEALHWIDVTARAVRLHATPLDVAPTLAGITGNRDQTWIFTSATLATDEDFSHFCDRMGLSDAVTVTFPSPYALAENGLVYCPPDLPLPSDPQHTDAVLAAVLPLLEWTKGGAFCLFTSHRALRSARAWLRAHPQASGGRPLMFQGDAPRDDLLRRFRDCGDAVLLGTGSFWEGVDVRGPALTIVAIDKLPFASPSDPLMMARLAHIKQHGGNGFADHQLPLAALALKQGAGRLLRDPLDFGVVALCDPRVTTKAYGRLFLECLKPMPVTETLADVADFLSRHERAAKRGSAVA